MRVEIQHQPSYSLARVLLDGNESLVAEPGALVGMSSGVQLETRLRGGFLQSLTRATLGGEAFFTNTFRAPSNGGEILLAPSLPGDIFHLVLRGEALLVQSGSYLASSEKIVTDTKWSGAKTFFSGEGLIMLRCTGIGDLLISSYGAIHEIILDAGKQYTLDTGHLVAMSDGMAFKLRAVGDVKSTLLGGEGLVIDLTGPGRILLQSRSEGAFLDWLLKRLPQQKSSE